MIGYDKFIDESYLKSNYAPIYHITDILVLERIIDTNTLKIGLYDNPFGSKQIKMVSLTRNKNLDMSGYRDGLDVILTLDSNILRNNYKIIPYDFFINSHKELFPKWNPKRKSQIEFEEIILNPITDIFKYLLEIDIYSPLISVGKIYNKLENYNKKYNIKINLNDELLF